MDSTEISAISKKKQDLTSQIKKPELREKPHADVAKLVDARDLKSLGLRLYGFDPRRPHHLNSGKNLSPLL